MGRSDVNTSIIDMKLDLKAELLSLLPAGSNSPKLACMLLHEKHCSSMTSPLKLNSTNTNVSASRATQLCRDRFDGIHNFFNI